MAKLGGCKAKGKDHTIRSPLHFNINVVYKVLCKNPLWVISRRKCLFFEREKCIHSKGWPSHFWQTENHPSKGVPFLVCTRRYEKFARKIQIRETCNDDRPFTIQSKKNTTNKNRFFYLRRILKVKLFLTKKNDNSKFFYKQSIGNSGPQKICKQHSIRQPAIQPARQPLCLLHPWQSHLVAGKATTLVLIYSKEIDLSALIQAWRDVICKLSK